MASRWLRNRNLGRKQPAADRRSFCRATFRDTSGRIERARRRDRGGGTDRVERINRAERIDHAERINRAARIDRAERTDLTDFGLARERERPAVARRARARIERNAGVDRRRGDRRGGSR